MHGITTLTFTDFQGHGLYCSDAYTLHSTYTFTNETDKMIKFPKLFWS